MTTSALDLILAESEPADWPDLFPDRLSPSSIELFGRCPERWRRKYLTDMREPWGGSAVIGMAVHRAAELNFAQKIESHEDMPLGEAREIAATSFEEKVAEVADDGIEWGDSTQGEAKDESVSVAAAYHMIGAPKVQPVACEEWFELDLPGAPTVRGRVDIRTEHTIPDVKTTSRKYLEPRPDWRVKGLMYARMTGMPVEWNVVTRTKVPAVYMPEENPGLTLPASPLNMRLAETIIHRTVAGAIELLERHGPEEKWPSLAMGTEFYGRSVCDYCAWRDNGCGWWS